MTAPWARMVTASSRQGGGPKTKRAQRQTGGRAPRGESRRAPLCPHPQKDAVAQVEVPQRREDMDGDQPHEQVRRDHMGGVEQRIKAAIVDAPWREQDSIEEVYPELAEVGREVARCGHDEHAGVEADVAPPRGSALPGG